MHCANVSSTKDYNQLNIYENGIASCTPSYSPDILHLLYFQSFDDGPDLYLDILINTAHSD